MGRLSLNKKYITNIRASVSGFDAHIFLGGSNNTISTFLNSAELTGNNNYTLADNILIYDINVNAFLTYFLRGDGVTWRRAGSVTTENNTIIPNNSIITLKSVSAKIFTMQGTNLVQKYTGLGRTTIKKQNLGGGKLRTHSNLLSNSRFDQNNDYPFNGYDANYNIGGPLVAGSQILGNYYHNSPLFYEEGGYRTIANKTFHEINSPYTTLLYGHTLQPRLLKMFGAGSKFGSLNNTNYLKTITSTTSYTPTDNQSWTKYGVEQIIAIPSWARKVKYGVKYLIISGDEFRFNNFGGLEVYFQKGSNRSYVNLNMVRKPVSVDTTALDSLETLYTLNNYVNFDSSYANAMCQWLGPSTSKVKVKRKSSVYIDGSNLDTFNVLSDTIDIPTFSTSGGEPDFNNGLPDYISIQMFFAEWVSYLNDSGIQSGAIYFYEPFLYFTEF